MDSLGWTLSRVSAGKPGQLKALESRVVVSDVLSIHQSLSLKDATPVCFPTIKSRREHKQCKKMDQPKNWTVKNSYIILTFFSFHFKA
jgi:hypothetical protein